MDTRRRARSGASARRTTRTAARVASRGDAGKGVTGVDPEPRPVAPVHTSPDALRHWLRVPGRLGLPGWVQRRLGAVVAAESSEHDGRDLGAAIFGVVDLETTGTSNQSSILEIGLVVLRGGRVLERFSSFVNPGTPVPWGITQLTGIEQSMIDGAPDVHDAIGTLARVLERRQVEVLVAHNAPFDRRFLRRAWEQVTPGVELPPFLCSLKLARKLVRAPRYALGALVQQLSIPERPRHRALGDAEMTASLWWELCGRARVQGVYTLEALAKLAGPGRSRPRRAHVHTVDASPGIG